MTDQYFKKFTQKSLILNSFSPNYLIGDRPWIRPYGLDVCILPEDIWRSEPLLDQINKKFQILHGVVIKIPPNISYNWHEDGERAVGINLKIGINTHSYSLFGEIQDTWNDKIIELKYEPDRFYLFNTQQRHCVLNFEETRYVFTVQFAQSRNEITYKEIYDWCEEEGLFDD